MSLLNSSALTRAKEYSHQTPLSVSDPKMLINIETLQAMLDRMIRNLNLKTEIHSAVDDLKHDMNSKLDNINLSTKAIKYDVDDLENKDKIRREDIDTNAENIKENNKAIEDNENQIKSIEKSKSNTLQNTLE